MSAQLIVKVAFVSLACLVLMYIIYDYSNRAQAKNQETFYAEDARIAASTPSALASSPAPVAQQQANQVKPSGSASAALGSAPSGAAAQPPKDCYPRDRLTAEDLLPKDAVDSKWAQVNPAGQGDVKDQNFLTAGYHVGINTIGSSLRNANLQLRSEPIIPQAVVSPFLNSTISPDLNRKAFEIGGDF